MLYNNPPTYVVPHLRRWPQDTTYEAKRTNSDVGCWQCIRVRELHVQDIVINDLTEILNQKCHQDAEKPSLSLGWRTWRFWGWLRCSDPLKRAYQCVLETLIRKRGENWTRYFEDSWIKRDQLNVTCFIISLFNAQHVSYINTSILRSLRLIFWVMSWVVLLWFDVCWCYVVVWLWWCGIRMQAEALLQPAYRYHTTPAKPQRNTNTHRTRAIQPMK